MGGCSQGRGVPDQLDLRRVQSQPTLVAEIGRVHAASGGTYGTPRVTAELCLRGYRVNPKRVARLVQAHRIAGIMPRRHRLTGWLAAFTLSRPIIGSRRRGSRLSAG